MQRKQTGKRISLGSIIFRARKLFSLVPSPLSCQHGSGGMGRDSAFQVSAFQLHPSHFCHYSHISTTSQCMATCMQGDSGSSRPLTRWRIGSRFHEEITLLLGGAGGIFYGKSQICYGKLLASVEPINLPLSNFFSCFAISFGHLTWPWVQHFPNLHRS